ncbi:MAG TPA: TonB-dependent receptor [Steroidobacteraceae bacterium]|jgi:outer membrane receptor protein involved in Fe transport|nr:TonB-dependent receptor [Steroidobacteraceae bacterium]
MAISRSTPALAAASIFLLPSALPLAFGQVADSSSNPMQTVVITAQHLNEERSHIQTQVGASTYTIDSAAINAAPGGENVLMNQVMLQVPDAAQDSFGQLHIRGDHNGLQFRLNGIILPDGISVFGQTLPPRLIESMQMIMGSLPAQYGLRSAGIIDLTTKSGSLEPGGSVTLYGGSHGESEPSFDYGGSSGPYTYFVTGDFLRSDLGIESPDGSSDPLHDHTRQQHGFAYAEDVLDANNRVSAIIGLSDADFQIPNLHGEQPALNLTVNDQSAYPSNLLNENQREVTQFGILSLQHSNGPLTVQTSFVARNSTLGFSPDPLGDLLYDGIAQQAYKQDVAYGLQSDGAYKLNEAHTLRAGVYFQYDRLQSDTTSQVLNTDASTGVPLNDVPVSIIQNSNDGQVIESGYVQDEWHIIPVLTLNYGLRFDHYNAFSSGSQLSPRVNFVWQPLIATTLHAGYSRYFSPPPFELVGSESLAQFADTTAAPAVLEDGKVKAERSNYYDFGVEQTLAKGFTVGVDSYYKQATDLIDEGQFGAPIILTPFNYAHGQVYGVEFTGSYHQGGLTAYANLASQRAIGKDIVSSQFNFDAAALAYIADHYIHLDHEQQITASGGVSYVWSGTRLSADMLLGSGLRSDLILPDGSVIPNGDHLPYYTQVNLGVEHDFERQGLSGLTARVDVINLLDKVYEIRNGTGVGVGAPQYGPRRGLFLGVTQSF